MLLTDGCVFTRLYNDYEWGELETKLNIRFGESSNVVSFEKIATIEFKEKDKDEAQMTLASGKSIDVSFPDDRDKIWVGGNLGKYGATRIKLSKVSSLEISKTAE